MWPESLSWSTDGRLAFITGEGRETWVNKGLAYTTPEDASLHWLINASEQSPLQPNWSPDGKWILYSAGPIVPLAEAYEHRDRALRERRIWIIEVESGLRRQLTGDNKYRDERPMWSSDGEHILFARLGNEGASLWLMKANGSGLKQIVAELSPKPDGYYDYGHIDWGAWWDWCDNR